MTFSKAGRALFPYITVGSHLIKGEAFQMRSTIEHRVQLSNLVITRGPFSPRVLATTTAVERFQRPVTA